MPKPFSGLFSRKSRAASAAGAWRETRKKWTVPVQAPMILISEVQRSGGTLVSQLFDDHPECFAHPYEVSWGSPHKWDWPRLRPEDGDFFTQLEQPWLTKYAAAGSYKKSPKAEHEQYPFLFDSPLQKEIFDGLARRGLPSRKVLDAYMTSFFNAWLDYRGLYAGPKKFVTGFTPRVAMHPESLAGFFRDYPDGYLVTVVRHPAGWYSSAVEHGYKKFGGLDAIMAFWKDSAESSLRAARQYGDRVVCVLFEDLVKDTEGVMRLICRRTGLTFSDTLLRPTFNGIPIRSNSQYKAADKVDAASAERFRAVVPAETVAEIERKHLPLYQETVGFVRNGTC